MTYRINGVDLALQPTTGRWIPRTLIGTTGDGHHIYPAVREFELRWGLASPAEVDQLYDYFSVLNVTGTVVVDLPQYDGNTYVFHSYSGCTLQEPDRNTYFTEHITDVVMMVTNIR